MNDYQFYFRPDLPPFLGRQVFFWASKDHLDACRSVRQKIQWANTRRTHNAAMFTDVLTHGHYLLLPAHGRMFLRWAGH